MRNPVVAILSIVFVILLAIACAACVVSVGLQPGKSAFMAALPGIGVAVLCAAAGCFIMANRLAPLGKILDFAERTERGEQASLPIGQCGAFIPLARAVYGMNKAAVDKEHWYKNILDGLPWAIAVTDLNMNWTFCNAASLKSMGKTSLSEVEGVHCSAKNGNICNTPKCGIEQLRKGNNQVINKMPNGKTMKIILAYLKDAAGNNIGHLEVGEDITEKIALEESGKLAATRARQEMVGQLEGVVAAIDNGSGSLNRIIDNVRDQAQEAAARLQEAATAMNEMNSTVLEVASNAEAAADAASAVQSQAQEGNALVLRTIDSLRSLRELSISLKNDMAGLDTQARDIGTVLTLIRDIADQTNLLALNAAIEAARAGEAGRGFAVVADEVRKLAEKTMSATRDVESAIESIQQGTYKSTSTMDNAVRAIEGASHVGEESGHALEHISQLAADSSMRVSAIAAAATQQSAASEEINRSITEVNHLSAEIARVMGESASLTGDMVHESKVLTDILKNINKSKLHEA
ncbi:MAG: methyl-accepting chemotaxis protein [Desulfovibrio sp.]|nr:methyl-accepting chemotaxis protein [Desulfovibrio sp.]